MSAGSSAHASDAEFDAFAARYEEALHEGLKLSGESGDYFAQRRVDWTGRRAAELGAAVGTILDYGCGTGAATKHLLALPGVDRVVGADVSPKLVERARAEHASDRVEFRLVEDTAGAEPMDLAYCNGVFHHIPLAERDAAVAQVHAALKPGALFALWENNPWNPGTRMVMRRIPFDRDAITLAPPETKRLLASNGFEIVRQDFLFIFPRTLAALRPLEARVASLPLGAQYMTLARKR